MKLSVITINFNHKHFPKLCVEALESSKTQHKFEIIFVDNVSRDLISKGFLEKAAAENRIKLIKTTHNIGFSGGNNLGAKNAFGEYLLFLNPDTAVFPDAIEKMINHMDQHRDIGILGPKLIYADGIVQDSCRRDPNFIAMVAKRTPLGKFKFFKKFINYYTMHDFDKNKEREVDWVTGAAILIPKKLFENIGGFDERYFLFMEDADLCRTVREKGLRVVYYPEAQINHYHQRLSAGGISKLITKKVFWHHVASMLKYFWKWRRA